MVTDTYCICSFVLQSLVYPLGISMDTLQANYSMVSGADKFITLNRSVFLHAAEFQPFQPVTYLALYDRAFGC